MRVQRPGCHQRGKELICWGQHSRKKRSVVRLQPSSCHTRNHNTTNDFSTTWYVNTVRNYEPAGPHQPRLITTSPRDDQQVKDQDTTFSRSRRTNTNTIQTPFKHKNNGENRTKPTQVKGKMSRTTKAKTDKDRQLTNYSYEKEKH